MRRRRVRKVAASAHRDNLTGHATTADLAAAAAGEIVIVADATAAVEDVSGVEAAAEIEEIARTGTTCLHPSTRRRARLVPRFLRTRLTTQEAKRLQRLKISNRSCCPANLSPSTRKSRSPRLLLRPKLALRPL